MDGSFKKRFYSRCFLSFGNILFYRILYLIFLIPGFFNIPYLHIIDIRAGRDICPYSVQIQILKLRCKVVTDSCSPGLYTFFVIFPPIKSPGKVLHEIFNPGSII